MAGLMDLFITISAEDQASSKVNSLAKTLSGTLVKAAKVGAAAVGAVLAGTTAITGAFISSTSAIAEYGDNIDKMSQKMGLSAQAYQEWDAVLQHSGTTIEGMQRGMMSLSSAAEKGTEAFQQIGLSQEQVASMSQEELFAATIKGLQGMEEGSERAVLAQKLLGGAAKELGPLLNTSAEDTEAMRQRVHELGGVMSDEAVKAAAAYQDSLQDMNTALGGLKNRMMTGFMPSITKVMDGLTELFAGNGDTGIAMISEGIQSMAGRINEVLPQLLDVVSQILGPIGDALGEQLPAIIETLVPVLIGAATQLVLALVKALPGILSALWEGITTLAQELWPILESAFGGVIGWFAGKFQAAKEAVQAVFAGWGAFFTGIWEDIASAFTTLGTKIGEAVSGAVTAGVNGVIGFAESAINAGIDLINRAIDLINKIPGVSVGYISKVEFPRLAIGKDFVPYDNYPAFLHKGEAVLTAREADEWRRGDGNKKAVTNIFNFNGVSQSDLDYIVGYVNRGLA